MDDSPQHHQLSILDGFLVEGSVLLLGRGKHGAGWSPPVLLLRSPPQPLGHPLPHPPALPASAPVQSVAQFSLRALAFSLSLSPSRGPALRPCAPPAPPLRYRQAARAERPEMQLPPPSPSEGRQ